MTQQTSFLSSSTSTGFLQCRGRDSPRYGAWKAKDELSVGDNGTHEILHYEFVIARVNKSSTAAVVVFVKLSFAFDLKTDDSWILDT